jgi:hypothetical protein
MSLAAALGAFRAGAAPARAAVEFHTAVADRVVAARVLAGARVDRSPSAPDASYSRDLWEGTLRQVADLVDRVSRSTHIPAWLLGALVAVPAAVAALLTLRGWWLRRRARAAPAVRGGGLPALGGRPADVTGGRSPGDEIWQAADWRRELDRLLAAGEVAAALAAAWWWIARSLAGERAQSHWTGGELLRFARRDDLRGLVRQLDAMTYGALPPAVDEVRGLAASFEAALA